MNSSTLRAEINQRLQKDPQAVIRALRTAGVKLSKEDETNVNQKWLERFTDEQIQQRFNKQVLEALGIKGEYCCQNKKLGGNRPNESQQCNSQNNNQGSKRPNERPQGNPSQNKFSR